MRGQAPSTTRHNGIGRMEFTSLERAVLNWLSGHTDVPELTAQIQMGVAIDRQFTGAGSYTRLSVPGSAPQIPRTSLPVGLTGPFEGPEIFSHELEIPACSLLCVEAGYVSCLEIAGPGIFDHHADEFSLQTPWKNA